MKLTATTLIAAMALCASATALASSHREAPSITKSPKVDATDFYMFNSYENNRQDIDKIMSQSLPIICPYKMLMAGLITLHSMMMLSMRSMSIIMVMRSKISPFSLGLSKT